MCRSKMIFMSLIESADPETLSVSPSKNQWTNSKTSEWMGVAASSSFLLSLLSSATLSGAKTEAVALDRIYGIHCERLSVSSDDRKQPDVDERRPSWKKDHQTEQKLNEKEAKWVSDPSSLLGLQDEEEGKSEGAGLCHGGKQVSGDLSAVASVALALVPRWRWPQWRCCRR